MNRVSLHCRVVLALVAVAAVSGGLGCKVAGDGGPSPSFLIIESLQAASGAEPEKFATILFSDVETIVERQVAGQAQRFATVFPDAGRVTFRLGLKDPGTPANPNAPTTINQITVTRYRVSFRRADGRSTPGVDVPYGFDGGITVTVPADDTALAAFEVVRQQMKEEPPLRNLVRNGGASLISTIAEVTFWGRDQAGNEVTVSGSMTVNFGDFADPE